MTVVWRVREPAYTRDFGFVICKTPAARNKGPDLISGLFYFVILIAFFALIGR